MTTETTVITIGSEWRTARKTHDCICGDPIRKGTRYSRTCALVDGSIEITKEGDHIHSFEAEEAAYQRAHNWF